MLIRLWTQPPILGSNPGNQLYILHAGVITESIKLDNANLFKLFLRDHLVRLFDFDTSSPADGEGSGASNFNFASPRLDLCKVEPQN